MLSGPVDSVEPVGEGSLDLEPAINGQVSANGLFPSQSMEDEFTAYLKWTKEQGLSRLIAFEPLFDSGSSAAGDLPTEEMSEQLVAYINWVEEEGISPFYAFMVTDFD
jgi:hypothetical protein